MKKIYKGWLRKNKWKGTLALEYNNNKLELIEEIQDNIRQYGNYLSVRYYIANEEVSIENIKKQWLMKIMGLSQCDYIDISGSEWTGYMWTDEKLNVGGHNLLQELYSFINSYLILEIDYSEEIKDVIE